MRRAIILFILIHLLSCSQNQYCHNNADLFKNTSIQDSLESYIQSVGSVENDDNLPTIVTVSLAIDYAQDTVLCFDISNYPGRENAIIIDSIGKIHIKPSLKKGVCRLMGRLCLVRYEDDIDGSFIINESVLKPVPEDIKAFSIDDYPFQCITKRPSSKKYHYHGRDSLCLIERYFGPSEK